MKNKRKKKTNSLVTVLVVLIVLVVIGGFIFYKSVISSDNNSQEVTITIEDSWYGKQVLDCLEENNVIKSSDVIYYYSKLRGYDMNFKSGSYTVNTGWDIKTLFDYLNDASNAIQTTVTINFQEGSRVKDFAAKLSEYTNLEYQDIIDYWNSEDTVRLLMNDYSFISEDVFDEDVKYYLEGYLFPDTYEFYVDTTLVQATTKILDQTNLIYEKYKEKIEQSGYTTHEIFTLSSIVQRESGNKEDMKNIASVFLNRLDIGMGLQSSVTVCYALDIGINDANWAQCEITQDEFDPYNTFQVTGFPPGPICNFSEDAIEATLNPNETDYFFFIGDVCGDGTTYFAETYAEQLQNEARYLTCY